MSNTCTCAEHHDITDRHCRRLLVADAYLRLRRFIVFNRCLVSPLPPEATTALEAEELLAKRDAAAAPLAPEAGSFVAWAGSRGVRTDLCVLYIHGWSASPREVDPVDARVATSLRANLIRFRLTAHGVRPTERAGPLMRDTATRDALLQDVATAYACAKLLGKRVVIVAASTGATLSAWLASQPWVQAEQTIAAMAFISPAFALLKPSETIYAVLKWTIALLPAPLSGAIINAAVGAEHKLVPPNTELMQEYFDTWTICYPTVAVQNLINLYLTIEMAVPAASVRVPTLFFSNPADPIASFKASTAFAGGMPDAVLERVTTAEMPHVITGRICSPSTVEPMTERIVLFLREKLGKGLVSSPPRRVSRSPVRSPSITAAWPR